MPHFYTMRIFLKNSGNKSDKSGFLCYNLSEHDFKDDGLAFKERKAERRTTTMAMQDKQFFAVLDAIGEPLQRFGFSAAAVSEDETTQLVQDQENALLFSGEKGALKIRYANERVEIFAADELEALGTDAKRILVSLLPKDATDKDVHYVVSEIDETLNNRFGAKAPVVKKQASKAQQTVSKAAVKNGSFYDPNTLASKLCLVFPELRSAYKDTLARSDEFLAELFFTKYGTPRVIEAIKENQPQTMKKLFQTLNEIYEDGTNDTQSLIAVTILGELNNDQILLARCVDYMSETMAPPVIEVNKFFATAAGKKAKEKLKNPPPYKPKKQKKPGLLSQLMAGGGGMAPPTL